jgi:NAD(P)-dependent dehydrogenase (short-subunit alcohol dehydrogenase family)
VTTLTLGPHRAVVIGAAGTIGSAICRAYAAAGAIVVALDKDLEGCKDVIEKLGTGHRALATDVTKAEAVERAACEVHAEGSVDSVAYTAGVEFTADVTELAWQDYRELMAVNLDGAFHVAKAFGRRMLAGKRPGSFAFISSTAGKRGEPGAAAYCATKFGMLGLVESFAAELGPSAIRVNAVCPGNVESPMLENVIRGIAMREHVAVSEVLARLKNEAAQRRLVTPAEVASVVLWLASSLASAVTGEAIDVDAGALYR